MVIPGGSFIPPGVCDIPGVDVGVGGGVGCVLW